MSETKTLTGHLVVNWNEGSMRYRKTRPDKAKQNPYEFVLPIEIDVTVPDRPTPKVEASVDVPEVSVAAGLRAEEAQHVDPEAWQGEADELVADSVRAGAEYDFSTVHELTGELLGNVEVYPDPTEVKNYIQRRLSQEIREQRESADA